MAVYRSDNVSADISTDQGFRDFCQEVHNALEAIGLVQTADSGQIDIESATTPESSNTDAGYEVWRFDDEAQATHPIYVRIDYGKGGGSTIPRLKFTVGTGSNGSGTISQGQVFVVAAMPATTVPMRVHACLFDGCLSLWLEVDPAETSASNTFVDFLLIERARRPDGSLIDTLFVWASDVHANSFFSNSGRAGTLDRSTGTWAMGTDARLLVVPPEGSHPAGFRPGHIIHIGNVGLTRPLRGVLFAPTGLIAANSTGEIRVSDDEVLTYRRVPAGLVAGFSLQSTWLAAGSASATVNILLPEVDD